MLKRRTAVVDHSFAQQGAQFRFPDIMNDSAFSPSTAELFQKLTALVDAILAGTEHDEHLAALLDYVHTQRAAAGAIRPGEAP